MKSKETKINKKIKERLVCIAHNMAVINFAYFGGERNKLLEDVLEDDLWYAVEDMYDYSELAIYKIDELLKLLGINFDMSDEICKINKDAFSKSKPGDKWVE